MISLSNLNQNSDPSTVSGSSWQCKCFPYIFNLTEQAQAQETFFDNSFVDCFPFHHKSVKMQYSEL